jgi:hypothetical protein
MSERAFQGWAGGQQTLNDRRIVLTQHLGPTSYTQITPGTQPAAPTGGDSISAASCGLDFIEAVIVLGDSSGKYSGFAFQPPVGTDGRGAPAKTVPLQWIISATGAEVAGAVNLSTFQLNLVVIGL